MSIDALLIAKEHLEYARNHLAAAGSIIADDVQGDIDEIETTIREMKSETQARRGDNSPGVSV